MSDAVAVITDIHGNLPALEASLERIEELGIERMCCGGDLVGYGPHPNEVCRLIEERGIPTIYGNYDYAIARDLQDCGCAYVTRHDRELGQKSVEWTLARTDHEDAATEEGASARLRVTVRDEDPNRVGKAFTAPLVELALASYPGFTLTGPPAPGTPYGVYRAAYVDRAAVEEKVVVNGTPTLVEVRRSASGAASKPDQPSAEGLETTAPERAGDQVSRLAALAPQPAATRRVPLGTIAHARSGDKGGDANVGVWARDARNDRAAWLLGFLTPDRVRALLPEAAELDVEVHPLPNLGAVNIVLHGLLGEGVAASSRFDPQAKAVGEWLRSRCVDVPEALL